MAVRGRSETITFEVRVERHPRYHDGVRRLRVRMKIQYLRNGSAGWVAESGDICLYELGSSPNSLRRLPESSNRIFVYDIDTRYFSRGGSITDGFHETGYESEGTKAPMQCTLKALKEGRQHADSR
jgi:hypothetical protein